MAETGLTPGLASWFAAAPPVPHGSVHAVAAKLSRIGQHAAVPRLHRVEARGDARPEPVLTLYGCTHRTPRITYGDGRAGTGGATLVYPCARLEIVYEGAAARLRAGRGDDVAVPGERGYTVIRRDRAREAGFEETLREAAERHRCRDRELLRHDYGLPRALREADIVFPPLLDEEDDAAAAGVAFAAQRVPELRAAGWRVEFDGTWPFRLYDWLIPGLLGNRKRFTAEFRTPIEKHGDRARQRLLSARVKPFLMRRTKEEVATDLPEKTVIDELVPLEGAQAALYESIRTAMDRRVREAIAARGLAASRIAVLDALLKLRQVCCDPGLVKLDAARKVAASAKRARLLALLEELVAEGRKVLVFSQFVEMLKLVERDIAVRGWGYPAVVIPVLTQHYAMLRRNLLYTGVTRGKRLVVLVGQKKAVAIAVRNASGRRRWSKLDEWLARGAHHPERGAGVDRREGARTTSGP